MEANNKYGLPRAIPAEVKRAVRARSGFGCVICGCAIYQYEHVDPPFAEAQVHDAVCMTLLCGGCHDRVTRRMLSKESVVRAMAEPACLKSGFSFGAFDVGAQHPDVVVGQFHAKRTNVIIRVFGDPILSVAPPEESGGPFLLSATLSDDRGIEVLKVDRNEWASPIENWDVEVVGRRITIRRAEGDITLRLRSDPPHSLIVERLNMYHRGTRISCDEGHPLIVETPAHVRFQADAATADGCNVGIDVTDDGLSLGVGGGSLFLGTASIRSN